MPSSLLNGGFSVSPRTKGSGPDSGGLITLPIKNSKTGNIMPGDPVTLDTDGTLIVASTSAKYVVGVAAGLKPEGQSTFVPLNYYPSGASAASSMQLGARQYQMLVKPAYNNVFEVQADGSVSAGDIGYTFDVTVGTGGTLGTGANVKGYSTARVHASSRSAAGAGVVKVVGLSDRGTNQWTDAYPQILVQFINTFDTKTSVA